LLCAVAGLDHPVVARHAIGAHDLDATSLGDRFVVLAVCVVYRRCAIPVVWTILPAGKKRAWRRE